MADSGGIRQFTGEMGQATREVAKDVKDSVGQAIEQGVQSVVGTQFTPQQIKPFDTSTSFSAQGKQKQIEDQKKLAKVRSDLKWYQDISDAQKKIREEAKQKQLQEQKLNEQEKQKKKLEEEEKKKIIISPAKKAPMFPGQPIPQKEEIARTRQEIGKGHGIGG